MFKRTLNMPLVLLDYRSSRPEVFCEKGVLKYFASCPNLYGNCACPKNFHIRKFVEILVFYAMKDERHIGLQLY